MSGGRVDDLGDVVGDPTIVKPSLRAVFPEGAGGEVVRRWERDVVRDEVGRGGGWCRRYDVCVGLVLPDTLPVFV